MQALSTPLSTPIVPPPAALITKYDRPAPRYTSYPTAMQFHAGVTAGDVQGWLAELPENEAVSVYIHFPYCQNLCLYCGCNMKVTNNAAPKQYYLDMLVRDIARTAKFIGTKLKISTLHFGGGTPTYMPPSGIAQIMAAVHEHFDFMPDHEFSVEGDPRHLDDAMIAALANASVNRVSLGVQDTNPVVQKAINRIQPLEMTANAVKRLRAAGITKVNLDILYGLPCQTLESITQTVADVVALNPDRLAAYGYAHVPWMKKHQTVLEQYPMPDAHTRAAMLAKATSDFTAAGYATIGIDHFAKPDDPLVQAFHHRTLNRNFMGYTTDHADTLLGFGCSAISQLPQGFAQNTAQVGEYQAMVADNRLPIVRGYAYQSQDIVIQQLIRKLMCFFEVAEGEIPLNIRANALARMAELEADGIVVREAGMVKIPPAMRTFTRLAAACFDQYLPAPSAQAHSKAV
ncbi:MAG: oxygen-independent coproporphyrinogen III oxidase [Alphaproteobacteria bacterium]